MRRLDGLLPGGEGAGELRGDLSRALEGARQLELEAARLRDCVDLADVVLVRLDAGGRVVMINAQGCRMLGHEGHELIGADWFETCVPAARRATVRAIFADLMAGRTEGVVRIESDVMTRAGQRVLIAWHNVTLSDEAGNPIGTLSSGRDISQLRSAQGALVESEQRLRAIFDTTVDAIITIDERGTVSSLNAAAERMFGYAAGEVLGRNVSMIMPAPYHAEHDEYLRQYLATGKRRIIGIGREVVGLCKDGSTFPIDLAVSEVRLGDRRVFTGVIRDITDRKRLEREVLEVSTQERERIGRDLHDGLGQELTGVAFLCGVLQRRLATGNRPEAGDAAEIVKLINTTIDHTRALVRGLCPVTSDPEGLMNSLRGLAEMVREVHRLRCRFDCPRPVLFPDHTVATHLYYIALEAVNNAIKHAKAREIVIGLYLGRTTTTLLVTDDGIGIPETTPGSTGGRGMHIMNYRARMIYGSLEVQPGTEGGTVVSCSFDHHPQPRKD
jgi:PAS domain S-box-containing protein